MGSGKLPKQSNEYADDCNDTLGRRNNLVRLGRIVLLATGDEESWEVLFLFVLCSVVYIVTSSQEGIWTPQSL